jgi:hypothetical protein
VVGGEHLDVRQRKGGGGWPAPHAVHDRRVFDLSA